MQAVLALCYFCENHGPRVLMTTQSIPENLRQDYCLPTTSKGSSAFFSTESFRSHLAEESRCVACTSFIDGTGLITDDVEAHISYITTQVALNDRVYQLVKYSCLHSLSCEVTTTPKNNVLKLSPIKPRSIGIPQGTKKWEGPWEEVNTETKDGVILFGDDEHGYTLSYTFRLRDYKARGFLRFLSLILISIDKLFITSNYHFFVSTMSSTIRFLQMESNVVFDREHSDPSSEVLKQATASRSSLLPAHFLRAHVTKLDLDTSRSLTLITGRADIFTQLHMFMVCILRTQTRLCKEYLLEGVPTQDMLIMKERKLKAENETSGNDINCSRRLDCFETLRQIAHMLENLPKVDGQSVLEIVLTQLVTGGQIVLKCQNEAVAKRFLLALSSLLPLGCVHMLYAEEYRHVFVSNLFGCPLETELSPDAVDIVVLLLDVSFGRIRSRQPVTEEREACSLSSGSCTSPPLSTSSKDDNIGHVSNDFKCIKVDENLAKRLIEILPPRKSLDFEDYTFTLIAYPNCTAPKYGTPAIVNRYKQLILDDDLSCRVLASVIGSTREQWLNKSKLVYQLGRQKEKIDLKKVLQIMKCGEQDGTVLLFFQAGLSDMYKQQVMNVIKKGVA
uniref:Folliculin n=1 Tax=Setaria digitata TaxID=48799 RepID=A0A915Q2W7_9BILA